MLQINSPIELIIKMLGEQEICDCEYRPLTYIQTHIVEDGLLVYNLMTRELVILKDEEITAFDAMDFNNLAVKKLVQNWFFVPVDNNDSQLFEQSDFMWRMIADNDKNPPITSFVIYPTTDCNARCFYCFELDCKRITMTEQTAHDVAEFIRKKSCGKNVHLMWFGGEPLYNMKAIDIICSDLAEMGIEYNSEMVSNGYLFDENVIEKAKDKWKLYKIQITLDGTEEVYNRCKNYIYMDVPSPFLRVIKNIELLLNAEVYISVRLNMDVHNCDNLEQLINQLMERFGDNKYLRVYISLLFEKAGKRYTKRSQENKKRLYEEYYRLGDIIDSYGRYIPMYVETYRNTNICMSDSRTSTTILPDGNLGKCEHFTDDNFYGSIYSDAVDMDIYNKFREMQPILSDECYTCPMRPKCVSLKFCPHTESECDEYNRKLKIEGVCKSMESSYMYFLKNQNTEENSNETEIQFCS